MKIATRLKLAGLFSAAVVIVISAVLWTTTQQVKKELAKNEAAGEILNAVTAVRHLTLEYVLRHEERARVQRRLSQASLLKLLTPIPEFSDAEELAILEEFRRTHAVVDTLFDQLVANQQERKAAPQASEVLEELDSRLTGQIINQTQAMISDALRLSVRSREGVLKAQQRASVAVAAFGGAVLLVIMMTLLLVLRSVTRPLERLRASTEVVGAGNLDYRLDVTSRDEIGDLARAFDAMTSTLKGTTVSRDQLVMSNAQLQSEITERKRTEVALRESQERNLAVVNTALDGIVSIDHEGRIVDFNAAAQGIFGHTKGDVLGRDMAELLIPPQWRAQHRQGLEHYLATGLGPILGQRVELTALRADGTEFPAELSITRSGSAHPPTFTGFVRDISERKLSEQKLQAQLGRLNLLHQITRAIGERQDLPSIFQVVVNSLEDQLPVDFACMSLHDSSNNILEIASVGIRSAVLATELAMTAHEQVTIDANGLSRCVRGELVYEPDISQVAFPFPQRLARGKLRSLVVAPLLTESRVFGVLITARHAAHAFSSGECEFLQQLSEHVALAAHQTQLYGTLHQAYDDLRLSQQAVMQQERLGALGQMASGIAHDINNAISPVTLYTETLLTNEPGLSARGRNYLETIQRSIEDVAQTVTRMGEFYRHREPQLTLTPVQLNLLLQQVIDLTRARWHDIPQQRGVVIQLRTELAPDLPVVMGIESEIREALINLFFNAIDAMPDGGTLTLRTKAVQRVADASLPLEQVHLEVEDTGTGMDEATRRRCLEPFFTTKGARGTGLGLAMVYGVVERHSAEIEIDSTQGLGTTMRLVFSVPFVAAALASTEILDVSIPRLRLLIVDDDPMLLKSLRDVLEVDGHDVTTANGGQAGIDAFRATQEAGEAFAMVITDLGMPHIDGRRVAEAVKQMSPLTPVILLTGWGRKLMSNGETPPHIDCILSKPPKLGELRKTFIHLSRLVGSSGSSAA
ncbi:two-component hybrid sensor and regulator [Acidovorax sp. Root267]|uniref:PAS domain S-box protein n=1 Tax=Acidovorax sp. Root267 TaxID=1736505 RepID=UPI00070AB91F|nr:PAS domain S-box protein [Acidovorax sp. Root267]KRD13837.1 two-component hybrid sensor and regulator [Acidovorax sp. Root267]